MSKKIHTSKALIMAGLVALPALNANSNENIQDFQMVDQGLQHIANTRDIAIPGFTPALFLDTTEKNDALAYTHCPQEDKNETWFVSAKGIVTRYMKWSYSTSEKVDYYYAPKSMPAGFIQQGLHKLHILPSDTESYKGDPLADNYNQTVPMSWRCNSVEEFRHFADHLKNQTKAAKVKPFLLLTIKNDADLLTLSKEDKNFIAEYFRLPASEDEAIDLKDFFAQSRRAMRDKTGDVESSKPKPGYKSFPYSLYANFMGKRLKNFETDKVAFALFENVADHVQKILDGVIAAYIAVKLGTKKEERPRPNGNGAPAAQPAPAQPAAEPAAA